MAAFLNSQSLAIAALVAAGGGYVIGGGDLIEKEIDFLRGRISTKGAVKSHEQSSVLEDLLDTKSGPTARSLSSKKASESDILIYKTPLSPFETQYDSKLGKVSIDLSHVLKSINTISSKPILKNSEFLDISHSLNRAERNQDNIESSSIAPTKAESSQELVSKPRGNKQVAHDKQAQANEPFSMGDYSGAKLNSLRQEAVAPIQVKNLVPDLQVTATTISSPTPTAFQTQQLNVQKIQPGIMFGNMAGRLPIFQRFSHEWPIYRKQKAAQSIPAQHTPFSQKFSQVVSPHVPVTSVTAPGLPSAILNTTSSGQSYSYFISNSITPQPSQAVIEFLEPPQNAQISAGTTGRPRSASLPKKLPSMSGLSPSTATGTYNPITDAQTDNTLKAIEYTFIEPIQPLNITFNSGPFASPVYFSVDQIVLPAPRQVAIVPEEEKLTPAKNYVESSAPLPLGDVTAITGLSQASIQDPKVDVQVPEKQGKVVIKDDVQNSVSPIPIVMTAPVIQTQAVISVPQSTSLNEEEKDPFIDLDANLFAEDTQKSAPTPIDQHASESAGAPVVVENVEILSSEKPQQAILTKVELPLQEVVQKPAPQVPEKQDEVVIDDKADLSHVSQLKEATAPIDDEEVTAKLIPSQSATILEEEDSIKSVNVGVSVTLPLQAVVTNTGLTEESTVETEIGTPEPLDAEVLKTQVTTSPQVEAELDEFIKQVLAMELATQNEMNETIVTSAPQIGTLAIVNPGDLKEFSSRKNIDFPQVLHTEIKDELNTLNVPSNHNPVVKTEPATAPESAEDDQNLQQIISASQKRLEMYDLFISRFPDISLYKKVVEKHYDDLSSQIISFTTNIDDIYQKFENLKSKQEKVLGVVKDIEGDFNTFVTNIKLLLKAAIKKIADDYQVMVKQYEKWKLSFVETAVLPNPENISKLESYIQKLEDILENKQKQYKAIEYLIVRASEQKALIEKNMYDHFIDIETEIADNESLRSDLQYWADNQRILEGYNADLEKKKLEIANILPEAEAYEKEINEIEQLIILKEDELSVLRRGKILEAKIDLECERKYLDDISNLQYNLERFRSVYDKIIVLIFSRSDILYNNFTLVLKDLTALSYYKINSYVEKYEELGFFKRLEGLAKLPTYSDEISLLETQFVQLKEKVDNLSAKKERMQAKTMPKPTTAADRITSLDKQLEELKEHFRKLPLIQERSEAGNILELIMQFQMAYDYKGEEALFQNNLLEVVKKPRDLTHHDSIQAKEKELLELMEKFQETTQKQIEDEVKRAKHCLNSKLGFKHPEDDN